MTCGKCGIKTKEKKKRKGAKKGFIFTLLVLVVIVFMIAELNIYFRTYQLRQETEPANIRSMVLTEFADQLSERKFTEVVYITAYNALYNLTEDSVSYPPSAENLSSVIWSMIYSGTRPDLAGSPERIAAGKTLYSWDSKLKSTAAAAGFNVTTSYSNFNVAQIDPWTIQLNLTFSYTLLDPVSSAKVTNSYPALLNVSISGFDDPMFSRAFSGANRNIFASPSPAVASQIASGEYGKGWFYGVPVKVLNSTQVTFVPDNKKKILVTDKFEEIAITYGGVYGAVIVVGSNNIQSAARVDFISVPSFVNQSLSISDVPDTPILIVSDKDASATGTESGAYHRAYNLEAVRNLAVCALYTNSSEAPSFFGRLMNNYAASSLGIETIYSGIWVTTPMRSGVDHEYINSLTGTKIMGMAGCHDKVSCNISTGLQPVRLNNSHLDRFGLTNLICTGDRCG